METAEKHGSYDSTTNWALRLSVAVVFVLTGIDKFSAAESHWIHVFDAIGFGQWFRYFTGVVEVVGGLLFLVPSATAIGAALLVATMVGAMMVQVLVFRHPADSIFPGAYLVGVAIAFAKLRSTQRRGA